MSCLVSSGEGVVGFRNVSLKYAKLNCAFQSEGMKLNVESYVTNSQRSYLVTIGKAKLVQKDGFEMAVATEPLPMAEIIASILSGASLRMLQAV